MRRRQGLRVPQPRALAGLALGCLAWAVSTGCGKREAAAEAAPEVIAPLAVQTEVVSETPVPRLLRLTGTLRGDRETDLAANANGRVIATSVELGQEIAKGDVLARVDTRALTLSAAEAAAQVKNVEAQESQARVECERYEALKAKGAVTDLEYQQKLTQCQTLPLTREAASARARLAAQNVGDGVIRAPFAGVVTERYVQVGQYLRQDSRVVSLAAIDPIRLELAVPEAEVANVKAEAKVSFSVAAYPAREFVGTIRFVSGALRPTTRDLLVEAVVENKDKLLRPGMFAEVRLTMGTRNVPSVPKAAVLQRDETARAFFAVAGRAEERILALGPEVGERVAVDRGAKVGDLVILGDLSKLSNGHPIQTP